MPFIEPPNSNKNLNEDPNSENGEQKMEIEAAISTVKKKRYFFFLK
jgi:hypothetical protein